MAYGSRATLSAYKKMVLLRVLMAIVQIEEGAGKEKGDIGLTSKSCWCDVSVLFYCYLIQTSKIEKPVLLACIIRYKHRRKLLGSRMPRHLHDERS